MSSSSPATSGSTPIATPSAAVGYFVDQKKGEVNELKQLLKNINIEKDMKRKREIIKKVIAYMTLGIDVARLFPDMIMAIETKDIVVKKMVYLYLCNYVHKEPDMAIMCINSLRRECDSEDPMVRRLSIYVTINISNTINLTNYIPTNLTT
jgi:vesicle coat complex subunit